MATELQRLLGVAPLENLRSRRQEQYGSNLNAQNPFGSNSMLTPVNTDFSTLGNQSLPPIKTQSPIQQNYFNSQMDNMGLQNPDSLSFGFSPDDVDPEDGDQETADPSGDAPEGANPTSSGMQRFTTDPSQLIQTALQALPPSQAAQYEKFLSDGTLSIQEIGALAGFNYNEIEPGNALYQALELAGAARYSDALANLGSDLSNAQEYRSSLFGNTLKGASREAGSLLGMSEAGSTSGLMSGRRAGQQKEATDLLENALSRQLLADESTYLGEVDSIIGGSIGQLQDDLAGLFESVIEADPDLAVNALPNSGTQFEDYPAYLQSTINSFGLSQNELASANSYVRGYFAQNGDYPSAEVFNNWYQTTFGDNENQDDYED
tara:strand:- start:127 stop:1260 length:1134 start_codon:yes stop_codon:yes gene_type:complete